MKNRLNIVLTSNRNYQVKDAVIVHSEEELKEELKKYDTDEIFVIGGESIYRMLEPLCDEAFLTKIDHVLSGRCTFSESGCGSVLGAERRSQ